MDIDECSTGDAACFDNSFCKNTDGSYKCKCNDGFLLNDDGTACNDVDECTDGTNTCDAATQECNKNKHPYCVDVSAREMECQGSFRIKSRPNHAIWQKIEETFDFFSKT